MLFQVFYNFKKFLRPSFGNYLQHQSPCSSGSPQSETMQGVKIRFFMIFAGYSSLMQI
jgi:hypothetical protein